jgi:hypothetical protein
MFVLAQDEGLPDTQVGLVPPQNHSSKRNDLAASILDNLLNSPVERLQVHRVTIHHAPNGGEGMDGGQCCCFVGFRKQTVWAIVTGFMGETIQGSRLNGRTTIGQSEAQEVGRLQ